MKKLVFILFSAVFMLISGNIFAHALWIETSGTGKVGKPQSVKVFYGEFAENERDSVTKWYSDVRDFTLWVVGPDQQKMQLTLVPGTNFYEGTFTPDKEGNYTLQVSHEARELGGTTKYHFLANTSVQVGKPGQSLGKSTNILNISTDLTAAPAKANHVVKLKADLNNAAASGKTVSVFSPAGWSKELKTNENGIAEFIPLWPGRYVVEVSDMDKTAGTHYGKDFTATWKGATYSFEVK